MRHIKIFFTLFLLGVFLIGCGSKQTPWHLMKGSANLGQQIHDNWCDENFLVTSDAQKVNRDRALRWKNSRWFKGEVELMEDGNLSTIAGHKKLDKYKKSGYGLFIRDLGTMMADGKCDTKNRVFEENLYFSKNMLKKHNEYLISNGKSPVNQNMFDTEKFIESFFHIMMDGNCNAHYAFFAMKYGGYTMKWNFIDYDSKKLVATKVLDNRYCSKYLYEQGYKGFNPPTPETDVVLPKDYFFNIDDNL